jgi:GMP synthase (glutamine-hydrolysing)
MNRPADPLHRPNTILVVLHQEQSSPGRVGALLSRMGFRIEECRPRFGDLLPKSMENYAGAVIFGGPMSANDPDDFIRKEIDWVGVALKEDKPLLGLCLGAQMIARHLGERVYVHEEAGAEIGYYPVRPTEHGRALCEAPFPETVYHWHREGFDLPGCATLLAEGDMFPVQGFQYGSATALQFHPEVTYINICKWTTRAGDRMHGKGAQPRKAHVEGWFQHDPPIAQWTNEFLHRWSGLKPSLVRRQPVFSAAAE